MRFRTMIIAGLVPLAFGCSSGGTGSTGGSSGSTGSAGTSGGTTGEATSGTIALSPESQRFLDQIAQARTGQAADLDGDGTPDTTFTTDGDGNLTVSIDTNDDGTPEFLYTRDAQFNGQLQIDSDSDGVPEETATFTPGTKPVAVFLRDTNFDGTVDQRETQTWDPATGTLDVKLEDDPQQTGTFTVTGEQSGPLEANAGHQPRSGCNAFQNFPSSGKRDSNGAVSVFNNGGASPGADGSCSAAEAAKLDRAVDCAVNRARQCLGNTNTSYYAKLVIHLEAGPSYQIGCGNGCGAVATTRSTGPWWSTGPESGQTNFGSSWLDGASDEDACDGLFHEMLHFADDSALHLFHDNGDDTIYSCARYCSGCNHSIQGAGNVNRRGTEDCAACADTLARKEECGIEPKYEQVQADYGFCHAGLSCISGTCTSYMGVQNHLCTGEKDGDASDVCCGGCPSNCNTSEDQACSGAPQLPDDTCNNPPGTCTHN